MANDNHLFPVPCYNGTMLKQDYYNDFFDFGQQKINFSFFELHLPDDDPVYTPKKVMEELDFSGLLACCSDQGRTGYNPIMLLLPTQTCVASGPLIGLWNCVNGTWHSSG